MRSNAGLLSFALAALSPFTAMAQPLLGLSLGPRLITVAEVWQNRSSGPIVQIEGSEAYQVALAGIAGKEPPERHILLKALTESLKIAQVATNTHFNRRVQIPVISLPSTVHDLATKATTRDATIDIGFSSREELQHIEMPFAAHYAYELGTAKGLGLEEGGCDWDMGVYEAILVDYNKDLLSISLIDLAEHGCVSRAQISSLELGENTYKGGSGASQPDTAQNPIMPDTHTQAQHQSIQQKLEDFLSQETLSKDSPSNTGTNWKPLRSDIRAVILAGDASLEGFDHMRSMLRDVFSSLHAPGWLKDSIDPKNMAAVGAAKRAQHIANRPEDFHVHLQHVDHSHDEL